jgi:hypothetical protein
VSVADVLHPSSHQWCAYRTFLGYVSYCACFLVGQALNNWGLALQVDLFTLSNSLLGGTV